MARRRRPRGMRAGPLLASSGGTQRRQDSRRLPRVSVSWAALRRGGTLRADTGQWRRRCRAEWIDLHPINVREEHGIIWYWYGEGEPAREVPGSWASEPGFGASEYWYDAAVPYLRIVENLADFHHFPILHKTMIPGIGTRMDEMDAHVENKIVMFSATMRYEKPGVPQARRQNQGEFHTAGDCADRVRRLLRELFSVSDRRE